MLRCRSVLRRRRTCTCSRLDHDRPTAAPALLFRLNNRGRVIPASLRPYVTTGETQRGSPATFFWVRAFASASSDAATQLRADWDSQIDNLLDQNDQRSLAEAQTVLEKALGKLQEPHSDWALAARTRIFDAWIDNQQSLLDSFDRSSFSAAAAEDEERQQPASLERRELVEQICRAANRAHGLLEQMEPFLGARNVWFDVRSSPDDDSEYHSGIASDAADGAFRRDDISHAADDELARFCNAVLAAWAQAVKACWKVSDAESSATVRAMPQRATFLLERMEASVDDDNSNNENVHVRVQPTLESYNRVLEAWSYSKEHLRATAAERIFQRMQSRGAARPDGESHRHMVWAWALSHREKGFAFHATGHLMSMLRKLERRFDSGSHLDDHTLEPALEDYHVVMKAWSQSE